jgi:Bacterial membrane protein YfhO
MNPSNKKQKKPTAVPVKILETNKNRFGKYSFLFPPAILFVVTAAFYWPILIGKGFLWNDFLEQNFVYRLFAAVSLKQGVIPFWNPYVFSGMPFFADVQAAVLYPLNLVLTLFAAKDWLSPVLVEYQIIFHVFMAGFFMYLLARDFGASKAGAALSGLTFMFCGFFTTHIFHVNLVHSASWFPLAIFLFKRTMDRTSLLYMALTALTLSVIFFCGYPQLMVHMYYWLAAYYLFRLVVRIRERTKLLPEVKRALLFAGLVGLGIGMSGVQMLTTQELARNSVRPTLEFNESCEGSFRPYRFITMIVPNYFGQPQKSTYWGVSENDVRGGMHNYWETAIYTGIIPLALAVIAPFVIRTPLSLFLSIMGLLSMMLAMGNSFFLYGLAFKFLPAMNAFRIPGRFAFMFSISVSILSGLCLTWLQRTGPRLAAKPRFLLERILLGAGGLFLVVGFLYSAGFFKQGIVDFLVSSGLYGSNAGQISSYVEREIYPLVVKGVWIFCGFFAVGAAVFVARLRGKLSARTSAVFLWCGTFLDIIVFGYGFAAGKIDPSVMYEKSPAVEQLQQMRQSEFFRINSRDSNPRTDDLGGPNMVFRKNQGSVHRLFLMEGYNPLRLKRQLVNRKERTLDILNVRYSIAVDPRNGSMGLAPRPSYFPRCRMVYDYAVQSDENMILPELYDSGFDYRKSVVLEEKPSPAPDTGSNDTSWTCRITNYSLNSMEMDVTTQKSGLLVLSEIYYPSWKARVDGKSAPLYRADYALRAIPVEKGEHKVSCYFSTDVFHKGLMLSLVSLFITLVLGGWGLRSTLKMKGEA